MKFEEIEVGNKYKCLGFTEEVISKDQTHRIVVSKDQRGIFEVFEEKHLNDFKPIRKELPKEGLLISKNGSLIYRIGEKTGYGFDDDKYEKHYDWTFVNKPKQWQPATEEQEKEFVELLKKESKKRGFDDDTFLETHAGGSTTGPLNKGMYIFENDITNIWNKNGRIFWRGEWATPKTKPFDMQEVHNKIKDLQEIAEREGLKITVITETK